MRSRFLLGFLVALLPAAFLIGGGGKPSATRRDAEEIPSPGNYLEAVARVDAARSQLLARFPSEPDGVLNEARQAVIEAIVSEIIPFWYGTDYDFNGTTEVPRQGKIACGYFVSTVLRDAGFSVERFRLAQQASLKIIQSLVESEHVRDSNGMSIDDFVELVEQWGPGVYVVGLDFHVGFIVASDDGVRFVHASYLPPLCVVSEEARQSRVLISSERRVLGKLTADDRLIEKWLSHSRIPTRTG